jgi:pilus assembly protein TadC
MLHAGFIKWRNKKMKRLKITKHLIDFIILAIGFSIADAVINFLGINYSKYLSLEFALTILIGTLSILIFQFFIFMIKDTWDKNKNSKV